MGGAGLMVETGFGKAFFPNSLLLTFADAGMISPWAAMAVAAVQEAGIVGGKPGNLYDPAGNASRAEVATIFRNFIGNIAG